MIIKSVKTGEVLFDGDVSKSKGAFIENAITESCSVWFEAHEHEQGKKFIERLRQ